MKIKPIAFFVLSLFITTELLCQSTFIINSLPDYTPEEDDIYIAGNFTGWQPGDPDYVMSKNNDDKWEITLDYTVGTTIMFKFTRGSWETVEKGAFGEEIADRSYTFTTGTDTIYFEVLNWADEGGGGGSTAADNVHILDENFYMPELDRHRRVWVYLPPGYEVSTLSYPVLYMHDGQNLFDYQASFAGEWEIDESLNELAAEGINVPIVVGIDNGGNERLNEYSPWINPLYGGGLGEAYIDFIVNTLKPHIDENYRTLSDRNNTAIMGSSMGGFISHYAILEHPDVFSKSGVFSPAYWFSDSIWNFTTNAGKQYPGKFYLLVGGEEGGQYIAHMWAMQDTLISMGYNNDEVLAKETPGASHNEVFWRTEFSEAYLWLFHDFANFIGDNSVIRKELSPNPVEDFINLSGIVDSYDTIKIINSLGQVVLFINDSSKNNIDVSGLTPGTHVIVIESKNKTIIAKFLKN